ncbi:multidrug resistance-associated protein 11 [Prunus dulcis]|uniref:ABC-type xenobiotic transporter n=1 Tax=Prunus dulcis TaxID=3755 RepID=A0A4Y1R536_PRUDU|nr:multidrug resistance-associated protein 11 [Prunus dulcis]
MDKIIYKRKSTHRWSELIGPFEGPSCGSTGPLVPHSNDLVEKRRRKSSWKIASGGPRVEVVGKGRGLDGGSNATGSAAIGARRRCQQSLEGGCPFSRRERELLGFIDATSKYLRKIAHTAALCLEETGHFFSAKETKQQKMDDFMNLICPNSPSVWDGNRLSNDYCYDCCTWNKSKDWQKKFEDSLLSADTDVEEGCLNESGDTQSYFDLMTFRSITSVMNHGVTKQLDFEDLLQLPTDMDPCSCHDTLLSCWQSQQSSCPDPSLFRAICCAYGWPYIRLGLLKVLNDCVGFAAPLLLNKLIRFLQQGTESWDGYVLAISLGLISIFKSFLDTQYSFHLSRLKLKLRSSIITVIYQKCLYINLAERSKFTEGEIQTFMAIDSDRTLTLTNWGGFVPSVYTSQICICCWIAITISLIPVNKWISTLIASATMKMMKQKDESVLDVLGGRKRSQREYEEENSSSTNLSHFAWEVASTALTYSASAVDSATVFCLIDAHENIPDPSVNAYPEVRLLSSSLPAQSLSQYPIKTLDSRNLSCNRRRSSDPAQINSDSLFTDSRPAQAIEPVSEAINCAPRQDKKDRRTVDIYPHFEDAWTRKYLDAWCVFFWATTPTLFSLFTFGLFALMGHQLDAATAIISIKRLSRFLSCSQHKSKLETTAGSSSPYFSNDKSEIFHEDKAVVFNDSCCAWSSSDEKDLDLVLKHVTLGIPKGSFVAVIGEVGSGKSSLLNSILGEMRLVHGSVYSCGSIAYVPQVPWILSGTIRDNILFGKHYDPKRYSDTLEASALDLDISLMVGGDMAYIGEKGINLSGGQRARIALARAMYNGSDMFILDDVLSAVDAQVARCILYNAILGPLMKQQTRVLCTHNVQAISSADTIVVMDKGHVKWVGRSADWPVSSYSTFSPLNEIDICLNNESQECSAVEDIHVESQQNLVLEKDTVPASDRTQEIIEVEARKEGRVELTIYKNYATFSGWFISVVICLSAILMQASRNGNDLWLSNWVDATRSSRKEYSTSFYLIILCIFCIVNSILTLVRAFSFAFGGLRAAVKVHDTLLKRLINAPVQFFDQTPGGRILNRSTSRELRRLDSVSRSPIYTSFTETLDGSSTIRAFKSEDLFFARFTDQVKLYQQTSYTELTASLWLSLRLQLLAAFIISFVAVMAVIGSHGSLPINFSTPGLVGLALSYAAPVVSLLGSFLTSFTETEKEMVSVERALEYMDIPQEELHGSQSLHPSWPYQGQIEFQNVTLRYKPSLPAALRDISFTIEGGMQVGFIGRTGAGKSSVLNALFRLTPICKGCILVDSINIASAPIRDLRGHFSVVPQTPFLFEGSLRDNLDPFQLSDDLKIWKALERCHVKEEVEAAGGLDIHLKESGMSFSVGQRQLLCLARALLKSSKVLCLDECTANVDTQTASIIQKTISSECRGMTVITIAHRISTVLNMDSVLVLDHGILVEQGNPQALLENESSRFSSFAKASTM